MNTDHINIETLSAYADAELESAALGRVEQHLASCAHCAGALARLHAVVAAAGDLSQDIAPPPDAWAAIKSRVTGPGARVTSRWWQNGWLATAAAVILIAGTAVLMPRAGGKAKGAKLPLQETPVVLVSVEKRFAPTIIELRETFDAQRAVLAPSTVKTLDHSLAVIDSAIADARQALASDPASATLAEMLAAYYGRKIDLLKRATSLPYSM